MRLRTSNEMIPGANAAEPYRTAETRKRRWLLATTLAGLLGVGALSAALFLTPEPENHALATKPLPETRLAKASQPGPAPAQKQDESAPPKMASVVSGAGKQARLAISPNRITVAKTNSNPVSSDKPAASITGIEGLIAKNRPGDELPVPASRPPTNHGDLITALKNTGGKAGIRPPQKSTQNISRYAKTSGIMPESTKTSEEIRLIVGKGDTLYGLLTDKGVSPLDATSIIRELKPVFSPRNLKSGHILAMTLNRNQATGIIRPRNMEIRTGNSKRYAVRLNGKGEYERIGKSVKIASIPRPLSALRSGGTSRYSRARARIQSSFYQSALAQDLPPGIVNKMTGILSYDVDFQREVNRGDTFEVLYTRQSAKDNGVLYAELVTNRKKHAFYRFKTPDGMVGYYNKNGESAQKAFMRTPVSGARITSRFGRRKHPILGYTKMHTGVDFGVARGTPIYAAASGTIQKAGWAGGYGKYVRIQHSKKLATAYGHMSRIARGIRPGKKVSQGQIIGYVGSTGRSTGPHLHYEIRLSGKPVNPMRYKLAKGSKKLSRKWLALFKKEKSRIDRLRKQIPVATNIASIRN